MCFSSYKNRKLKVKLYDELGLAKEKRVNFLYRLFCPKDSVLNTLPEYTLLHTLFLLVFKIVESLQYNLNDENSIIKLVPKHANVS